MNGGTEGSPWLPSTIILDSWVTQEGRRNRTPFPPRRELWIMRKDLLHPNVSKPSSISKPVFFPSSSLLKSPAVARTRLYYPTAITATRVRGCKMLQNGFFPNSLMQTPRAGKERDEVKCSLRVRMRLCFGPSRPTRAPWGGQSHPT